MEEKNDGSIFRRALGFFKKDIVRDGPSNNMAPLDHTPSYNNSSNPLETKQQEFLDWQIDVISKDLYTRSVYYDSDRITSYADFRAMDNSPEIAAAMSIIRDECLEANTIIPLTNGRRFTIEELYGMEAKGFQVFSYNMNSKSIEPATCERVVYKGKQEVYKIIFKDGSFAVATTQHLWLLKGKGKYSKTLNLENGDEIQPFSTKKNNIFSFFKNLFSKGDGKKIVSTVEYVGMRKTYDLVNVGEYSNFAILTSENSGVISHNCLVRNERGNILEIYSKNARVKDILKDLFHNRLNVDYNLRLWIRELVKYGDFFLHLHIDGKNRKGVYDVMALPAEEIHRQESVDGIPGNTRFYWDTKNLYFEDWQVAHFRLIEDVKKLPYGRSILDPARKLWKQLQLAEDAMLVYRLCLDGESRVKTTNGYKYIKDIDVDDVVYSYTESGELIENKVIKHECNGVKDMVKIKTQHTSLICTPTHPILVKHDVYLERDVESGNVIEKVKSKNKVSVFSYVDAQHLQKGTHQIILPNKIQNRKIENKKINLYNKENYNFDRIDLPKYVDVEFARLFGFMLGGGCIRRYEVSFLEGVDEGVNEYYKNILEKYFNTVNYQGENDGEYGKYIVNSKLASEIFEDLGFLTEAKNKRIPSWVFNCSDDIKKSLVLGLADADGCTRLLKTGFWTAQFQMCNQIMIEDIKELWNSIGLSSGQVSTKITKDGHTIEGNKIMSSPECWCVYISEKPIDDFENIISIEYEKTDLVYDITVENAPHNFIANGMPVHNTRAPERRVFYIDVGSIDDADVKQYIEQIKTNMTKQPVVDARTGQVNLKYNPASQQEDYYIPVRNDKSSKIETLAGACLSLDTKISLLDGRSLELSEIIKEHEGGRELWSYSINPKTGEVVPGKITWAGVTRKNTDVVKITLDNGETITTTPDHKFPTKFNGIKEAKDLSVGESMWSFETKHDKVGGGKKGANKKCEMIFDHSKKKWLFTHRVVANYLKRNGCFEEFVFCKDHLYDQKNTIHHKDMDCKNNNPENKKIYSENGKKIWKIDGYSESIMKNQQLVYSESLTSILSEYIKCGNVEFENILIDINKVDSEFMILFKELNKNNTQFHKFSKFTHSNLTKLLKKCNYSGWKDFKQKACVFNHKIVSVEFLKDKMDTGTITIDGKEEFHDFHNFALSVGIFTQNSNMAEISDIEYLEKKLFAALQVPKPYLNYTDSMPGGSMLAQADLRFARMINSVQEAVVMEMRRMANVHLLFMGYEDELDQFTLSLTNPSTQQELLNLETWKTRLEVFKEMFNSEITSPASYTWAMENVLGFSKEEIKLILKQKKVEKKMFAEIESAVETYKKIGLFHEIDKKFENQAPATPTPGVEGEIGASDDTGGADFGGGSSFDVGVEAETPTETPEEVPAPESPLAESKNGKLKKLLKESDNRMESFYSELLGEEEEEKSVLLTNNELLSTKTFKLKESMSKVEALMKSRKKEREEVEIDEVKIIQETSKNGFVVDYVSVDENKDDLLKRNSNFNEETRERIEKVTKLLRKDKDK